MKVKLYIEGGGDSHLQDTQFREGWRSFFEKAGLTGKMPRPFRGSGRGATFDAYKTALRNCKPNELPLLLVDSEDLVADGHSAWQHLKSRNDDNWDKPEGAGDRDAYLMICCMETWFIADRATLATFFGSDWRENALPKWSDPERVPKPRVFDALDKATAACGKRRYMKGKLSFDLLSKINPAEVEEHCLAAKCLLNRLRSL